MNKDNPISSPLVKTWLKHWLTGAASGVALVGAVVLSPTPSMAASAKLNVFDWSGYDEPSLFLTYVDKYGAAPNFSFYGDDQEGFEKLRSGFASDLAHPCAGAILQWREAGLMQPLDANKIKNYKNIVPAMKKIQDFVTDKDGKMWVLPFDWGLTGLLYRTDKLKDGEITSLAQLTDAKYAKKISIPDAIDDAYVLAALATGVKNLATMSDQDFAKMNAYLRKLHPNVLQYWSDITNLNQNLVSGEINIAWTWNLSSANLTTEAIPHVFNKGVKEGSSAWVCGYVRLAKSKADEAQIYDFLNALMEPSVSNYLVTEWGYGHANDAGMKAIDVAALKAASFDDFDKILTNSMFQSPLPVAVRQKMSAEFEKIKAGY